MNVDSLRVRNYRSIEDSGWVSIHDLTCVIGKNESGKTAFMRAVEQLNPSYAVDGYTPRTDYPRQDWPEYSDRHDDDPDIVASARLELDQDDVAAVEAQFGKGVLAEPTATLHRDYGNEFRWELEVDPAVALEYVLDAYDLPEGTESELRTVDSLSDLPEEDSSGVSLATLEAEIGTPPRSALVADIGSSVLEDRLPEFRYVGEYSIMDGSIVVEDLLEKHDDDEGLDPGDRVFLALLSVAGLDLDDFRDVDDWRAMTAELEATSAKVSAEAMQYWTQSGDLEIRLQPTTTTTDTGEKHVLDVRVQNRDRNVTVEFERRSHGFRRFFSTFCLLSEIEASDDVVLLLDEPGLNLHARAKREFLAFMKHELAPRNPIVYTTHSPFMIDPEHLHRTKMVSPEPTGPENVFTDVSLADEYTRFPLRNVLELDLMDTLLVRPQTLLVEEKADHVYLYVVTKLLQDLGKRGLDSRWTVVPITNSENIDSFSALFGEDALDVAALLNERPGTGRRDDGDDDGIPIRLVPEYGPTDRGTIEDVLSESFYLEIVNQTYASEIAANDAVSDRLAAADVRGTGPIVERLRSCFEANGINDGTFDRAEPALYLQRNRGQFTDDLDRETRINFTRLFTDLNNVLESFDGVEPRNKSFFDRFGLK